MDSIRDMQASFRLRAEGAGLKIDCPMSGVVNAEIAIVAEAPGISETARKQPLVGTSGALLWKYLNRYGITRVNTYVTNVIKRQLVNGPDGKVHINKNEKDSWASLLRWELSQLPNLRIVLVLGNEALQALHNVSGITHWRGSVLDGVIDAGMIQKPVTLVVANNPAMVIREPKTEIPFAFDLGKLDKVVKGKYEKYVITPIINPSFEHVLDFISDLRSAKEPIAYDIEVISGQTACIGLANNGHSGMCINLRTFAENAYTTEQERGIYRSLQQLFKDQELRFIAQHGSFDATWLWYKDGLHVPKHWHDTMLAHHTLYPTLPHDLGFLCTQYTTHPYYKDERKNWREGGNIDQFWEYNVKDCCITWEAARKLDKELIQQGLDKFFYGHVMRLQPHLTLMTVGGIAIDMSLKEKIANDLGEEVAKKKEAFYKAAQAATGLGEDYLPNPNSTTQMGDLYFGKLKLVGRGTSTDAANRDRMFKHPRTGEAARQVIAAQNAYAEDKKFLSTYAEMEVDPDGRARCEWKQTGTQTAPGRLSSAKVMWGSGMNLQNQPRRAHPMFIADPGYTFVYFDQSQAEARYVAWDAKIEKWIEQFERARLEGGYDAHRALASEMFNLPYDEVPTDDEIDGIKTVRFIAKRCRHGLNYRMGPDKLAQTAGLTIDVATIAYNKYHRITPELRKWWMELEREVRTHKVLYNSFGRRFQLLERLTPESLESIVAFRPQSSIGDKVSQVIYLCHDDPRWPRTARMGLNIHDADIALCRVEDAPRVASIMKHYAEQPMIVRPDMPPLIIPADVAIADPDELGIRRWSTLHKVKNVELLAA